MDNAVSLVQAYLRLNGYLTVTEFPVIVEDGPDGVRTLTDLDVLAFRFPGAGLPAVGGGRRAGSIALDPALGADGAHADMIIGEVKEGRARLNASALDRRVIEAALVRFGCCTPAAAPKQVQALIASGVTRLESGHLLRLVVFGGTRDADAGPAHVVGIGQVVRFLREFLRTHWSSLRHVESKDPAFGFLITLEKALRDHGGSRRVRPAGLPGSHN
jgi:hypothetical protein